MSGRRKGCKREFQKKKLRGDDLHAARMNEEILDNFGGVFLFSKDGARSINRKIGRKKRKGNLG